MNAQVATERKSSLPLRLRSTTVLGATNSTPTASRSTTPVTAPMPLAAQQDTKLSFTVGNRVLVNGLKSGILRYIGTVQFARGLFCGVELDEPDGKHDGQVNNIRYFQCKANHGIFVPQDKVVLAARDRALTAQRSLDYSKPPPPPPPPPMTRSMTRSMTIISSSSSTSHKIKQIPIKTVPTTVQLPDIIPSPSTSIQSLSMTETINNPISTDMHEIIKPTEHIKSILKPPPAVIEDPPETIEADFTDSVSLILHQLQQEQKLFPLRRCHSITISEEGTIDDMDEDDDIDDMDTESIADSMHGEQNPSIQQVVPTSDATISIPTDLIIDVHEDVKVTKTDLLNSRPLSSSNKSLASSTPSIHQLKINPIEHQTKPKLLTPASVVKKVSDRKLSVPSTTVPSTSRKTSLAPSKKGISSSTKSVSSSESQTKLNQSLSSSASGNSSRSDLSSIPPKPSNTTRGTIRSTKKTNPIIPDDQSIKLQAHIQSLESINGNLKKQYQHLLNQFELMYILNQYHIDQNEQNRQEYRSKLSKVRGINHRLKISIKDLRKSHRNELITLYEQHHNQLQSIREHHKQESAKYQQEIDTLSDEKLEFELRCTSLQDQVNRFMEEMANSEYADPLLRHVETLEKDRTSLQTVLELRNQELTQLRTRINEQTFQREDQIALQKRIDMIEHRNQDLVCLLRNWQLNEKTVVFERDQLKEQLAQLERDNQHLKFEKETLIYSLRQRSTTISSIPISTPRPIANHHNRANSLSSLLPIKINNHRLLRSTSLNSILHR